MKINIKGTISVCPTSGKIPAKNIILTLIVFNKMAMTIMNMFVFLLTILSYTKSYIFQKQMKNNIQGMMSVCPTTKNGILTQ